MSQFLKKNPQTQMYLTFKVLVPGAFRSAFNGLEDIVNEPVAHSKIANGANYS